jgi:hypothetical protein
MATRPFTTADLAKLAEWDTPTICNGLEIVAPERRAPGFTVEPMVAVERKFLDMARSPGFNAANMADALKQSREIH